MNLYFGLERYTKLHHSNKQ